MQLELAGGVESMSMVPLGGKKYTANPNYLTRIIGQAKLGYMYMAGIGGERDLIKAYGWLKLAAQNKNDEAEKELKMLELPKLSDIDKIEADKFIKDLGPLEPKEINEE